MLDMLESRSETHDDACNIDTFRARFTSSICSSDLYTIEGGAAFSMRFDGVQLGAVEIFRFDGQGIRGGMRTRRHIRCQPADDVFLVLPLNDALEISQRQHRNVVQPGHFVFISSAAPSEGTCGVAPNHIYSELVIKMPNALLRQQVPHIDDICAVPIDSNTGAGRVVRNLIESLLAEGRALTNAQALTFGPVLINAVGVVAREASGCEEPGRRARKHAHERIRMKALAFIESHLSDPQLDTAKVAEHCRVSLRHLHASFDSAATSVGAMIREMRLQCCRAELVNPLLSHKSIIEIAMAWGFNSSVSFTRAYRRRFGVAPSQER
ncbi:helix-turn-helix protein [Paraburkholderia unamae]|uniref:AraC-like ligand-binding domain-containing protein n=1 Tax=Paraburkholderia unamae TaxID=219649 RepID=UPI000DC4B320|nr:helix-turn-helix domain-containing protein [Paraburkholderia unamae]RAR57915.1 helix-turn-helix protein [Paraburkholderia unamae]